jgi:pimeloyl-ACP methyl ester carboxylesterase
VRAGDEVNKVLMSRDLTPEQMAQAMRPYVYDSQTPAERIEEDLAIRRQWFPRPEGYAAQLQGILAWESYSRLPQITAPTLVIHGDSDQLVPPGNCKLIAERIPGAEFVLLAHASHIFATDQPEAAHKAVLKFLSEYKAAAGAAASRTHG